MTISVGDALTTLEEVVHSRMADANKTDSYVASLAAKGRKKIAEKVGEEAVETIIAALTEDDKALVGEASDLVFHLTILMADRGLAWADIAAELTRRHGTSGIAEKAARQS